MLRYLSGVIVLCLSLYGCSDAQQGHDIVPLKVVEGCDAALSSCTAEGAGIVMNLQLPAAVRTLQRFPMRLELSSEQSVEAVMVSLEMVGMDMGSNRYVLQPVTGTNGWQASVMLPVCSQGRSDWVARFTVNTGSGNYVAVFPFTAE